MINTIEYEVDDLSSSRSLFHIRYQCGRTLLPLFNRQYGRNTFDEVVNKVSVFDDIFFHTGGN